MVIRIKGKPKTMRHRIHGHIHSFETKKVVIGVNKTYKPSEAIHIFPKGQTMKIRVSVDWDDANDVVIDARNIVIISMKDYPKLKRRIK